MGTPRACVQARFCEGSMMLLEPFIEFSFMRRALACVIALSIASAPLGCYLMLRRMSLVGDAMSHAMLPGAAVGFLVAGLSVPAMSLGGFVAALVVGLGAGMITHRTRQREDASFAALYLIALALGVLMLSAPSSQIDLMHLLFGSVLAVDNPSLYQIAAVSSLTCLLMALFHRALVMDSLDPKFARSVGHAGTWAHFLLIILMVANLVSAFQALGTLMAVGLMMLPAAAARFWCKTFPAMMALSIVFAISSSIIGLLMSYYIELPSGPSIVLVAGALYVLSMLTGSQGSIRDTSQKPKFHTSS